jgi:hypothetical protein
MVRAISAALTFAGTPVMSKTSDSPPKPDTVMDSAARIELYVPERAVARREAAFQQWVETVTAPLRYVCVGYGSKTRFTTTPLGTHIENFGNGGDAPRRDVMSAFSGFSMARDQRGVWFREGTGAPEEDRVTIYSFLVAREVGELAYFAIRERLAKKILRELNEQAVMLTRMLDEKCGLQMEFIYDSEKDSDYRNFAIAFESAAENLFRSCPERIDLAWKQLHLLQLLYRDMMASAFNPQLSPEKKMDISRPLFTSLRRMVEGIFEGSVLDRMSTSVLVAWAKIAKELHDFGDEQAVATVMPHVEQAMNKSILEIADSLWRFQGHSFAGARDLDCDSFGIEAFTFVAALDTSLHTLLDPALENIASARGEELRDLSADPTYVSHFLLRDWRGLSYTLNARGRKDLSGP